MSCTITTTATGPRTGFATRLAAACAFTGLLAVPSAAAVTDFRLPPEASQEPSPPARQGPVVPDVPESRARPTPSPTATATASSDLPTVVPPLQTPRAANDAPASRARTQATPSALPNQVLPTEATDPALPAARATSIPGLPGSSVTPVPDLSPAVSESSAGDGESGSWLWALIGLAALGALAFASWNWRQRQRVGIPSGVPDIERPRLTPATPRAPEADELASAPAPSAEAAEPLQVTLEPLRLSLTLMNATLAYRLEVANRGTALVETLRIGADMISAHASMTREEQLSGPAKAAAVLHRIERLEPGESRIVEGEFRLPFPQIVPIRQGNATLLLPLARFRLEAAGAAPVVRTFVVGQPGASAGLQPFRLDLGPRVYPKLAQRAFA